LKPIDRKEASPWPIPEQSKKRARQSEARYAVNKARRSRIRTFLRKVEEALASGKAAAAAALKAAQPELARGVTKGVLHKNTVARKMSRLTSRVKARGDPRPDRTESGTAKGALPQRVRPSAFSRHSGRGTGPPLPICQRPSGFGFGESHVKHVVRLQTAASGLASVTLRFTSSWGTRTWSQRLKVCCTKTLGCLPRREYLSFPFAIKDVGGGIGCPASASASRLLAIPAA
jgi:small subunit ribosomal protein S20